MAKISTLNRSHRTRIKSIDKEITLFELRGIIEQDGFATNFIFLDDESQIDKEEEEIYKVEELKVEVEGFSQISIELESESNNSENV